MHEPGAPAAPRPRLDLAHLRRLPPEARPALDPGGLTVGIVHLGVGAFHRAHQAVYTERASELSGETRWGICAVSERSPAATDLLRAQDGLYSLRLATAHSSVVRVLGSLRETLHAGGEPEAVVARIADPSVSVVTLTVTEKGYRHDPATGRLVRGDQDLAADAAGRPPRTVVGQVARGLEARRRLGSGPLAVCSCDNLTGNGTLLRRLVGEVVARGDFDDGLDGWIASSVTFPCSMVDRIVPATTPDDLAVAAELLGVDDRAAVVAEPFTQWVLEDDFRCPRPPWELAGADFVADVAPYEALKLRVLNGSHSALAYLGALGGFATIAEAAAHPGLEAFVRRLVDEEVAPTLELPGSVELGSYRDEVLGRFANPVLRHRCTQVASDGSQKLGPRLLGTVRDRLAVGASPRCALLVVAAWARVLAVGVDDLGRALDVPDPLAGRVRALLGEPGTGADAAERLLGLREVFSEDLAGDDRVRGLLAESFAALASAPALDVATAFAC